ncbi:MAG: VWA-like domain-containing protein [Cyanobacteria bacterium P01_D01_bin.50]
MTEDIQKSISSSLLRLQTKSPFFATLAMFARFVPTEKLPTAATDGKDIFYNVEFLLSLTPKQLDGVLLHEVLHAALLHVPRRGVRDAQLWNIAADIVINGMIATHGFELPEGTLREVNLEHLSVEEVYEILLQDADNAPQLTNPDLLDNPPEDAGGEQQKGNKGETQEGEQKEGKGESSPASQGGDSMSQAKKAAMEAHWRNAMQQAATVARTANKGNLGGGIERELENLNSAQIDWRSYLWRYLVQTPTDFSGFDRRFIGRRLYLESLQGESIRVYLALDTSGSIDTKLLGLFFSEVQGILSSYPHIKCEFYYVDAEVYGPYEIKADSMPPKPQGGGGTSFVPFFDKVAQRWDGQTQGVCVYLTDGYGTFPDTTPELPVLWVVTPGGLSLEEFPFGEAVRLLSV